MNTAHSSHQNLNKVRLFTALASLLLSLQAVYFDDILNSDAVRYLQLANDYSIGGLAAIQGLFDWPAFSILIAWVHQLTSLSIETTGFVLNSLFFILLTDALVLISNLLVASPRQLSIAAVLILCFTPINEYRDFILRDPGYWAFSSLALYQFMLFYISPSYKSATLWQIFMVIAILFRIEGIVILLGLPLFLLFAKPAMTGMKQIVQASYLLMIGAFLVVAFVLSQPDLLATFGRPVSILEYLNFDIYTQKLTHATSLIEHRILNHYSKDYAAFIFISGLLAMFTYKLVKAFSLSYLIVYLATFSKKCQPHAKQLQQLLLLFVVLNIILLLTFLFKQYFISSRYTLMALIGTLLLLMHGLTHGIEQLWLHKNRWLLSLIAFSLFYSIVDNSTMSHRKSYIKETAIWAAHNLPQDSLVMTDNEFIMYYFETEKTPPRLCVKQLYKTSFFLTRYTENRPYLSGPCADENASNYQYYDYLITVVKRSDSELMEHLKGMELEQVYSSGKQNKKSASVYKVIKP